MASLKRILNDQDSPGADEERYGRKAIIQCSSAESFPSFHNQSYGSLAFDMSYSDMWDTVLSWTTPRHDANGPNSVTLDVDAALDDLSFLNDRFDTSHVPAVLDNPQGQSVQPVGLGLCNGFTPTLPHDMTWMGLDLPIFDHEPCSGSVALDINTRTSSVEIPGSQNASDYICYGTVYRTALRLMGDMLQLDYKLQRTEGSYGFGYASFSVRPSKEEITLHFSDGMPLGSTNTNFNNGVQPIFLRFPIRMEGIAQIANVRDRIGRAKRVSDAIVRVDINVYGPRKDSVTVGKILSDGKIWLQKPDILKKGLEYDNPQSLRFEEFEQPEFEQQPVDIEASKTSNSEKDDAMFKKVVEDVFNKLTRGDKLQRVGKDRRVKTELLPHQEEGLDFMIQREFGPIKDQFSLWKREEHGGVIQYRHAVTNATSIIQHPETGGGVLADEMGMGKSLSILSLVTKTSDRADEWLHGGQEGSDDSLGSSKTRSKATLIIVSSGLLINEWLHEMSKHLDGSINFVRYHGGKRKFLKDKLEGADMIFTTYNTLVRDFQHKQQRKYDSSLHEIDFFRIVLDEAHIIRRKGTLFNKAVSELSAKSRWCLTGTPIQNKFEDIGALFAFIRARPFHNISSFRHFISNAFNEGGKHRALAIERLITLIDSVCIRRTRARLKLPEAREIRKELIFSDLEQRQYDKTVSDMSRRLKHQVGNSKTMHNFGLFSIKLQLRILCNHGTYQNQFAWKQTAWLDMREYALTSMVATGDVVCSHCEQTMPVTSARNIYRIYGENCRHVICDLCSGASLDEPEDENTEIQCPICAQAELTLGVKGRPAARKILDAQYFQQNGYSTKMTCLVNDLQENLNATKSIVFSCWTRTLELISRHLKLANIAFERIDGHISLREREKILEAFAERKDLPVLIMTTGTGAYGLNLTAANRIFIIEPQWNPAVENQAISRAIRLGQADTVHVIRYTIKDTVEQDMRSQQNQKIMIAGILDRSVNTAFEEQDSENKASDIAVTDHH